MRQGETPLGPVAAVCVYGQYVPRAVAELEGTRCSSPPWPTSPRATSTPSARAARRPAVEDGASEVDVVLPWRAWLDGDRAGALAVVEAARRETPGALKVILESG